MSTVEYRTVPGFPNYKVGDDGSVLTCWVYGSKTRRTGPWYPLKPKKARANYLRVSLYGDTPGKPREILVHQLVLLTFVGPCPPRQEVRHLDGDRHNNSLANLCYGTRADNYADAIRLGEASLGDRHYNAQLTNEQVRQARQMMASGSLRIKDVADYFGVTPNTMYLIRRRTTWKHV